MDLFLKVNTRAAKCPDHNIRAGTGILGQVAVRVWNNAVVLSIVGRDLKLAMRILDQPTKGFGLKLRGQRPLENVAADRRRSKALVERRAAACEHEQDRSCRGNYFEH